MGLELYFGFIFIVVLFLFSLFRCIFIFVKSDWWNVIEVGLEVFIVKVNYRCNFCWNLSVYL